MSAQDQPPSPQSPALDRAPAQRPLNEQATEAAWRAFRAGNYPEAITNADQCITRFRASADQIQAVLETNKVAIAIGTVSPAGKEFIARNGLLNDVATCLFIKGSALEKLGRKAEASKAFAEATKYTFARSLDAGGTNVWAPAQAASERMASLKSSGE